VRYILHASLALLLLLLLSLLLVVVGAGVVAFMGRPVFFRENRLGVQGRPFSILKFRSMRIVRGAHGRLLADAERRHWFGQILRHTNLDELPQLWNVLKGDMFLVGPRPLPVRYLERYTAEQARRHTVRPGITGWAQVHRRTALTWRARFQLDLWYIDNQSFLLDLRILLITFFQLFSRKHHPTDDAAVSLEFEGGNGSAGR
jgi:sugar transferase EpsL